MDIELGGDITLKGFNVLENGELIVVKKLVGRYARKLNDQVSGYKGLTLTMKKVGGKNSSMCELHAQVNNDGSLSSASHTGENVFIGIDSVLKMLIEQV